MNKKPLVSILIPNRNHAIYLGHAIESALAQTYSNIEILVCDNCSDDNSIEVAMKYYDRGVRINKNPINVMSHNYNILSLICESKYFMMLCADDMIKPTFIEQAVNIMEKHDNVGYVHCERDYIDTYGNVKELDPFFNCSFIVSGEAMLPIYMMTDVAQAAQGLIRKSVFEKAGGHDTETDYANIEREQWFRLSMISDYAYLREKLSLIRIHEVSATTTTTNNFMYPVLLYKMLEGFLAWATIKNYQGVIERKDAAFKKLGKDVFSYAIKFIKDRDFLLAKKYLLFVRIIDHDIENDPRYLKYLEICERKNLDLIDEIEQPFKDVYSLHKRSYDPPAGYIKLSEGDF